MSIQLDYFVADWTASIHWPISFDSIATLIFELICIFYSKIPRVIFIFRSKEDGTVPNHTDGKMGWFWHKIQNTDRREKEKVEKR